MQVFVSISMENDCVWVFFDLFLYWLYSINLFKNLCWDIFLKLPILSVISIKQVSDYASFATHYHEEYLWYNNGQLINLDILES